MILSVSEQARLFLLACAAGFVAGLVYDAFRVVRAVIPHPSLLIQAEDTLYWAVTSVGMFVFLHHTTGGEVRLYLLAGAALGAIVYFAMLSPAVMKVSLAVIGFAKRLAAAAVALILLPVKAVLLMLWVPLRRARKILLLARKPFKKLLQNVRICVKIERVRLARQAAVILRKR